MAPSVGKCVHKNKYIGRVYCTCVLRHVRVELYFYFFRPNTLAPRAREKEGPAHIEDNSIFSAALKGQWREIHVWSFHPNPEKKLRTQSFLYVGLIKKTISRYCPLKVSSSLNMWQLLFEIPLPPHPHYFAYLGCAMQAFQWVPYLKLLKYCTVASGKSGSRMWKNLPLVYSN